MLLLAPQSGKKTHTKNQQEGILLLDPTAGFGKKPFAQVHSETREIAIGVREKSGQLNQFGQNKLVKQLDRVSVAVRRPEHFTARIRIGG